MGELAQIRDALIEIRHADPSTLADGAVGLEKSNRERRAAPEKSAETESGGTTVPAPATVSPSQLKKLAKGGEIFLAFGLVGLFAGLFVVGRAYWDDSMYTAEEGIGYSMGLVGGVMMLLAFTYSASKHLKLFRSTGMMKAWLRVHIVFGVVGPLLGVLHSTFTFQSLNGGVFLTTMLLVFLSGVIGRYLYSKVHYGLGGRRAQVKDVEAAMTTLTCDYGQTQLDAFKRTTLTASKSLLRAGWHLLWYGQRSRRVRRHVMRSLKDELKAAENGEKKSRVECDAEMNQCERDVKNFMSTLEKVAFFNFYERFFAFWRHAHVPLLFLLLISGSVHVYYVHMY